MVHFEQRQVSAMKYMGIDPGQSGAIAVVASDGSIVDWIKCSETEHDLSNFIRANTWDLRFAVIEKVHSMPKQGVSSSFKFGYSYGILTGLLVGHMIPYSTVTPQKWQAKMQCRTGGNKNVSKARAQQLWPKEKIIHANADALLLAEYCRLVNC